jgi:hypothetical protein
MNNEAPRWLQTMVVLFRRMLAAVGGALYGGLLTLPAAFLVGISAGALAGLLATDGDHLIPWLQWGLLCTGWLVAAGAVAGGLGGLLAGKNLLAEPFEASPSPVTDRKSPAFLRVYGALAAGFWGGVLGASAGFLLGLVAGFLVGLVFGFGEGFLFVATALWGAGLGVVLGDLAGLIAGAVHPPLYRKLAKIAERLTSPDRRTGPFD